MKKVNGAALLSILALTLTATPSLHAADRRDVGQWEFISTVNGEAKTRSYCVTPAQVKGVNGDAKAVQAFLEERALVRHCTIKDFTLEGNTISYTQVCASYTVSDRTTYNGDSSEGVLTTTMNGQEPVVKQVKGRRVGACK